MIGIIFVRVKKEKSTLVFVVWCSFVIIWVLLFVSNGIISPFGYSFVTLWEPVLHLAFHLDTIILGFL